MKEVILIKLGELVLKGLNRSKFENVLVKNIKDALEKAGDFDVYKAQSTIYIEPKDEFSSIDMAISAVEKVFGIMVISPAAQCEKNMDIIKQTACEYVEDLLGSAKTFKVEAKRADKAFSLKSPEIQRELGGFLLSKYPHLKVDVKNPEVVVTCEIRDYGAYIHGKIIQGAKGLPVGTGGRAMLLLSGGIDSPVAGYMLAKRGVMLEAIHFYSYPYTSERAKMKVLDLAKIMSGYTGPIKVHVVPFTEIQTTIHEKCRDELFTIAMRRYMMRIACQIAKKQKCDALITGESLGQVASQTIQALGVTNDVANLPVFRPLIGMDKEEIIKISRKMGAFETSILPYEDCCTVFTPKHPKTKPNIRELQEEESKMNIQHLIEKAIDETEVIICK